MALEEGKFVDDYYGEDMLAGVVVRSAIAAGEILSISHPKLPGDVTLFAAEDIPGKAEVSVAGIGIPVLASRRVHYLGEPILLLCGPDERKLYELRREIEVRYRPMPPETFSSPTESQLRFHREAVTGDPDSAFGGSFQTVEGEYATSSQNPFVSDPLGAVACVDESRLIVYCPSQWPFHVRDSLALLLGLPRKNIAVRVTSMSAHKDSRIWYPSVVAAHAALLAWKTQRCVKLLLSREEQALVSPRRAPSRVTIKTAIDGEGNPIAHDIHVWIDGGAFPVLGEELLDRALLGAAGCYRGASIRIRGDVVATSAPPMDAFLGLGLSQGFFAAETHASRIAELSQLDPFTWKDRYILKKGDPLPSGCIPATYPPEGLLARVAEVSDFSRKHSAYEMIRKRRETLQERAYPLRGIGISAAYQGSGFSSRAEELSPANVVVRMEADGRLFIFTSGVSADGAARREWAECAGRILGIDRRKIFFEEPDTDRVPNSGPSALSRNGTVIGELVERASESIVKKRFRAALPIEVKKVFVLPRARRWDPESHRGQPFTSLSWAASVVETEVDPLTLETTIRGIWMTIACGRVVDMRAARRIIEGSANHALWWCTSPENLVRPPHLTELPPMEIEILSQSAGASIGGIEELAGNVVPSAYLCAVAQATGRYFDTLPLTLRAIIRYGEEP